MVDLFTAKTINSEKAIYFLSRKSFSINKLKSHMLFTCRSIRFVLSDLTLKKLLLQEMVRGWRPPTPEAWLKKSVGYKNNAYLKYAGQTGEQLMSKIKKLTKKSVEYGVKTESVYNFSKLS